MLLDIVTPTDSLLSPWVFRTIGAVGGVVIVLLYLRRRGRPPQA